MLEEKARGFYIIHSKKEIFPHTAFCLFKHKIFRSKGMLIGNYVKTLSI